MASKLFDADAGINLSTSVMEGSELGATFFTMFEPKEDVQRKQNEKRKKPSKRKKEKAILAEQLKRDANLVDDSYEKMLETGTPPSVFLHPNPSAFNVFANIRQCVLERRAKEALNMIRKQKTGDDDSESEDEADSKVKEPPAKMAKVVGMGLSSVFELIRETQESYPDLCQRALQALLDMLQGQLPESMKNEPPEVTGTLYTLLMDLTTSSSQKEKDRPLTCLACSCLISLVIAVGDTSKILSAVSALLRSSPILAAQSIQVPGILISLQRSIQAVLTGKKHIPEWRTSGIKETSLLTTLRQIEGIKGVKSSYSAMASDGKYLYIHSCKGLFKIGSGFDGSIKGHIYTRRENFRNREKGWLSHAQGTLFFQSYDEQATSVTAINVNTLVDEKTFKLGSDNCGPHSMFCDGEVIGHVLVTKDDSFVARMFSPSKSPMPMVSELPLRLSQKCVDVCGYALYDEERPLHSISTGFEKDVLEVGGAKDFALARTAAGKLLYTGKCSALGIKSGGPAPGKWTELVIPKAPKVVHFSVGHETSHAILVSDNGTAFFVGTAKRGEDADASLAKGRRQMKANKPKIMTKMDGKRVVSSACGAGASALVTDKGELYMFGKDLSYCDNNGFINDLREVRVSQVALGKAHVLVVTDKGELFTFGVNNKGQCGRDYMPGGSKEASMNVAMEDEKERDEDETEHGKFECPPGMHRWKHDECLICPSCGECSGYGKSCVSSSNTDRQAGTPCGCGLGDSGCSECGICKRCAGERDMDFNDPGMLMEFLASRGDMFRKGDMPPLEMLMSMGKGPRQLEMIARKMEERRYRRGRDKRHKLHGADGIPEYDDPKATSLSPAMTLVGSGKVKVKQVACGLNHSAVLLENGEVYTFGNNQYGQLGHGDVVVRGTPTRVPIDDPIVQVACGSFHTVLLTDDGRVSTFGYDVKGELGRLIPDATENGKKLSQLQSSSPGFIPELGPSCSRRASWIASYGSQTYIRVDESIINQATLAKSKVFANQSCIGIIPKDHPTVKCVMINRQDGTCKTFTENDQVCLSSSSVCMDPVYDNLWSYDTIKREVRCYNVVRSEYQNTGRELIQTQSPEIAVPVKMSSKVTRSHSALYLLAALDTLTKAEDLNLTVAEEKKVMQETKKLTLEDFLTVNRFESLSSGHGGGWGYSGHSVEAIRFSVDSDCILGGFGLFGGRGEYYGKIKLYELGPEGGENEVDGVVIAETDEVTYACPAREKYSLLFEEPVPLQANNWYAVWAKVSGPSSDCGSSGQSVITTEDQIVFKFKSSKKSNNGTDTNAGQIPLIYYKLPEIEAVMGKQSEAHEPAQILTRDFSRTVAPECFDSLLNLLNWSWSTFNGCIQDMQSLSGSSLKGMVLDLQRLVYICTASLHLLTSFICKVYPKTGNTKHLPNETSRIADCVCETRAAVHCILAEHIPLPPAKITVSQGIKEHARLADNILHACHRTFTMCFHAFYPTGSLKWLCLCDLLSSTNQQDEDLGGCAQQLAAVMDALSHPSVKLLSILPINAEHGKEHYLRQFSKDDNNSSSEVYQYPVLVEHMLTRTEMEGGASTQSSFKEILDRLMHIVTLPVRQTIRGEQVTYPDNMVANTCALLTSIIQELSASATWLEADLTSASRPLLTTPNRFTRTSSNAFWNAGNGSPDAVTFTVDRPGIVVAGVTVYGGTGRYEYELELLDDRSDTGHNASHAQRWNSLGMVKGSFNTEDCVTDIAEIKLERPVPIKEGVKYAFRLRNSGAKTLNGDGGMGKVKCPDGTTFTFTACSLSTNGTSHTRGQLPQILYYSTPDGDDDEDTCRLLVEYQSRKNAVNIASSVIRGAADLFIRAQNMQGDERLLQKVGSAHMFSALLPMVLAYIGPVASQDPRSAVQVLALVQHILPPVSSLSQSQASPPGSRRSSFSGDNGHDSTTSQHYAIVESDHPYKPATVTNYKVTFPDTVKWMTIEFDPQSSTAQFEDCLWLYVPVKPSLRQKPVAVKEGIEELKSQWKILDKFSGTASWPKKVVIIPGNDVTFSLETASDYAKNDKASFYGFKCTVLGYEWTNKISEGIPLLEKEISYLGGMCAAAIMRQDMTLPASSSEEIEEDLHLIDEGAKKIFQEHKGLLSKGYALSQPPTVSQALEGTLPLDIHSNERSFLNDFISCTQNTTGGRLARWLQPESHLDPKQCEIVYNKEDMRCNWPCTVTIQMKDQYCNPVNVPNVKVVVKAVPIERTEGDDENQPYQIGGSILYGGQHPPNVDIPYRVSVKDNKDNFHAITMMPEYDNYSFEELRFTSPGSRRPSENMTVRPNHDGTLTANWTPSSTGWYNIHVSIDGYTTGEIYRVEVRDPPVGVAPPSQSQAKKQVRRPKKLRKFVAKYTAGLRIRLSPSLQGEMVGTIKPEGVIEFVDELHNDDGVWLKLSSDSTKDWCSNGYTEAWCLQYNQVLGKTLMVPVEEPKSIMDEMVKEAMKKSKPELVAPPEKLQPEKPKDGSGVYIVMNCGPSGHNIRMSNDMRASAIGVLSKGDKVVAKNVVNSMAGIWIQLTKDSIDQYCHDTNGDGYILIETKNRDKVFLRHETELFDPVSVEPTDPFAVSEQPSATVKGFDFGTASQSAPSFPVFGQAPKEASPLPPFTASTDPLPTPPIVGSIADPPEPPTVSIDPTPSLPTPKPADSPRASSESPQSGQNATSDDQEQGVNVKELIKALGKPQGGIAQSLRMDRLMQRRAGSESLANANGATPGVTPTSTPPETPKKSSRSSSPKHSSDSSKSASPSLNLKSSSLEYRRQSTSEWVTPPSTPPVVSTPPLLKKNLSVSKDLGQGEPNIFGKEESRDRSPKSSPRRRISGSPRHGSPAKGDPRYHRESSASPSRTAATQTSPPPEPPFGIFNIGAGGSPKKEDTARMSPKLSRKGSRSQSLRSRRDGRSSSPVPQAKPSALKSTTPMQQKAVINAMTPSVAECLRTVFAAFLWHEGIVHDAMACASFLKFHPNLAKEMPSGSTFVFDIKETPAKQADATKNNQNETISNPEKMTNKEGGSDQLDADTSPKHGQASRKTVHFNINLPPEGKKNGDKQIKKERHKSEGSFLTKLSSQDDDLPSSPSSMTKRSELLPTLKHLVYFWEAMTSATIRAVQEKSITPSPAMEVYKPRDRYDLQRMMMDRKELRMMGMKFGEMSDFGLLGGANKDRETMCDLCGGMYPHPVTYHMRKAHHGCGNPAGGQGYNSGGIFCGGWAGSCGDGGIGGSSWYLICHQCREGYLKEKRDLMAKESYRGGRRGRKVKSKPISNHPPLEAHHIMTNNALFLLNLASSSGVNFSSNKSHDAIMSAMTRTDSYLPSVSEESFLLDQPAFPLVPFQYLSQRGADDADSAFNEEVVVAQDGDKIHTIKAESLGPGPRSFEMRHRLRQAYLAGMFDPKKELKSPGTSPSRNRHSAEVSAESSSAVKQAVLTRSISEVRPSGPQAEGSITDGFDLMGNTSRRTSFRRRNISGDSGLSLLKNPSVAMSRLIRSTEKGGRSKTMSEKAMQRPVMTFVLQHHDLGNLQLAMKQSIRKAALRVHALQALNWLVRTVTQPVCLHDLLWYFIMAFTPLYPDYAEEDRERENRKDRKEPFKEGELYSWLSVCEHPKQDISLAGEAAQPLETNFHGFLQTISDVMMHLPQGSALQQMAVRCWSFKFKPSDHQFLHKSHVFSNISKILSKSEGEDDELNGHVNDFAPVTSFVECLKDLTSKAELKVSSRFAMATSLTDNSTETFWESGDEDKNKTKTITITMPSRNNPKVVYVHIDNSRDLGSKVSSLVFSVGTSVEDLKSKYKQMDIEARHAGWISCHITEADCSVVRLELRGPDNHLRVRQVKILGEVQGESMKIGKQLNVLAAQEKKCESETLRVFRLLTSEVFGRLISEKSEVPELPRSDSKEDLEEAASEAETDLKEHMVGILFSRKGLTLTHLQKQVCEHIVQQIRKETFRVREEWENGLKMADPFTEETRTTDAYCFELLSMVLALSGSKVGCIFIAKQHDLLHDLLSLLHTGTPRVQRQVTALLRRVLPEVLPHLFARNLQIHTLPAKDVSVLLDNTEGQSSADFNAYTERILDVFLACIAKSLTVQMKSKKAITSVMLLDSPLKQGTGKQRWYLKGHISDKLATEIIRLLKDMASGKLSDEWAIVTKAAIAEAILNLTKLEEDQRTPAECIKIPTLWLALASLCVLDQDHTERLSSGQWVKGDGTPSTPRPTCDNHDDGQTPAIILCAECGNLCADCDRFLHLPQKKRSHQRQIFKEEEEAIKVDLHEGCGRTKLFWILALADSKTLKALVEFREGTKSKAKPLPFATGTCRFCGTTSKSGLLAVGNVCSDPDCQEYSKYACTKTLPCGHLCGGIKDEETCLPCLNGCSKDVSLKQDADDMCMICFTEALNAAPAVQLQCGHVFHHQCSRNILDKRWVGPRITFGFSLCPICKVPIDHPVLKDLLDPIRSLQDDVRRKALMRLEYEGLHKAEAITTVGARFHNDPAGFAMERYSYYVCFKCKKAYYGGEARCDEEAGISEDYNPAELVCGGCSDVSRAQMCPKHGMDFLEYKCRYCCSVAVFFCFGTTHFCNACHDDFQRVTNVPKSLLPHCPAGPRGKQLEGDECPLHVQHPATGEEFALGCGVCRNAHTF